MFASSPPPQPVPTRSARCLLLAGVVVGAAAACGVAASAAETAADATTRVLLEKLEERKMPDVAIWVLDRVAADPSASADLKAEVPFRRALALVGLSRTEADAKKRSAQFDEAQKQIDQFLASGPQGRRAIDAYTQKGNLLIERGRQRLEQAKRPGADVDALRKEAAGAFDQAIKALEGKVKPGEEITKVDNAEDAVIKELRAVDKKLAEANPPEPSTPGDDKGAKGDDKKGPKKPPRRTAAQEKELERLEAEQTELRAKLVQTRLMVASAYFEKAKAYLIEGKEIKDQPKEWTATLEESTKQFRELAEKYPNFGGGLLARYYLGRNLAVLGKRAEAVAELAELVGIDEKQKSPLAIMLRSKALNTSLECWLADKKYDAFDVPMRAFALTEIPVARLNEDWLGLKYRAALMLKAQADAFPAKEANKARPLKTDAAKLATVVAKANRDFAVEARTLLAELVGEEKEAGVKGAEKDFESLVDDGKLALAMMQQRQFEAKKLQSEGKDAAAALKAAAEARDEALATFDKALALAAEPPAKERTPAPEQGVNYARYMRTFLLYDAKRYTEAADLGLLMVEQFPNATGSRQAGMIALASLQQLAKGGDAAAATAAKEKLQGLARSIARIWPTEKEGSDALGILLDAAIETGKPQPVIELMDALPANAAGRCALLARAGTFLWRKVTDQGRADEADRAPADTVAAWKGKARGYLDEALKGPVDTATVLRLTVTAALSRCQIALDEGDAKAAVAILENPVYGPWTVVNDPKSDASLREGSFADAVLTVAQRSFVQAEQIDKAQQATALLEKLAAAGPAENTSERLKKMYTEMAGELQERLERLGNAGAIDAEAREKAVGILADFEKCLDSLAKSDPSVAGQLKVAQKYQTLGSGKGAGAVVPREKAEQYLDRAADIYTKLLETPDDADVAKFELKIRRAMAEIFRVRGRWDEVQEQIDWILSDKKRQNSPAMQEQAAELLQAWAQALAATDAAAADTKFLEAITGRTADTAVVWGWGGIASKLSRQAFEGSDENSLRMREIFFTARLNQAACLLARSRLPGKSPEKAAELLEKARDSVRTTRKMRPELGGPAMQSRFEALLKEIQKQRGEASPRGFAEFDEQAAAEAAPAAE